MNQKLLSYMKCCLMSLILTNLDQKAHTLILNNIKILYTEEKLMGKKRDKAKELQFMIMEEFTKELGTKIKEMEEDLSYLVTKINIWENSKEEKLKEKEYTHG